MVIEIEAQAEKIAKENVSQSLSYLFDNELSELYNTTKLNALAEVRFEWFFKFPSS